MTQINNIIIIFFILKVQDSPLFGYYVLLSDVVMK